MYKKATALLLSAALTFTSAVAPWADEIMAMQGGEETEDVLWDLSPEEDAVEEEWEETIQVFHDVPEEGNGDHEDEDYGDIPLIEDMDPVVEDLYSVCEEETEQEESREEETETEAKAEPASQEEAEAATEEATEVETGEETGTAAEEMTEQETEECTEGMDEEEGLYEVCLEEEAEEDMIEAASSFEDVSTKIYFIDQAYQNSFQIPSSYPQEYQIDLTGIENPIIYTPKIDPCYQSSQVSETGLVTIKPEYWHLSGSLWVSGYLEGGQNRFEYNTGTMVYRVCDGQELKFTVTVEVADCTEAAYLDILKQAEDSIDTSRGDYQTFVNIVKYVARNYNYSASCSSARGMILSGGGDCWASTDMIVSMGKDLGLDVRSRKANHDPGSGNGHYNAIAKINGKYYIGEAGYSGTKPRPYTVSEEPGGFAFLSGRIYQYDGDDEVVTIPSEINGRTVTTIGYTDDTGGVFSRGKAKVTAVNIPATVTSIYDAAFFDATCLTRINVDPANTKYKSIDGVLYSKDGTTLIKVPNAKAEVTIPEGVTALNRLSLDCCTNLKTLELPSTLTTIGEGAFFYMSGCTITIPASVTEIGANAFTYMSNCAVQVEEGSYAASYCEKNRIRTETYTVNENGIKEVVHLWDEGIQETAPGCEEEGTLVYTCSVCKEKRYEAIPALGHDYEVLERREPDCLNAGRIRHIHCKRCDRHFAKEDAATAADKQAFVLPALGHAMVVTEPAEATCTEAGTKGYYTCSRCKRVFADAGGTERTTVYSRTLWAAGHDMTYHSINTPTCTQAGNYSYYECGNCGHLYEDFYGTSETTIEKKTIPAFGHAISLVKEKSAVCTEEGCLTHYECANCGKCFSDAAGSAEIARGNVIVPAAGHNWASGYTVDIAATMEKEGTKSIHCLRCGEKKTGSEVKTARTEPVTIRKKVAKVKAKTKKSKVTVSWKKLSAKVLKKNRISGIQIRVAKDRTFREIVKDKRVGKKKKTWKFSANKGTYYVKIRYYGPKGYSKWSKVIRVKAK